MLVAVMTSGQKSIKASSIRLLWRDKTLFAST